MRRISILGSAVLGSACILGPLTVASCSDDSTIAQRTPKGDASVATDSGQPATDSGRDGAADSGQDSAIDSGQDSGGGCTFTRPDAGRSGYALFVGSDFVSSELSVVSLDSKSVAGRLPIDLGDTAAAASGGFGFVLLRQGPGKAIALDLAQPWLARSTINLDDAPDAKPSNPRTVVVTACTKAYAARFGSNTVKVFDAATGASTGGVDLSAFLDPSDPDGLVDVQDATYDPATHRVYFLLERFNQFPTGPFTDGDFLAPCLDLRAQLVAVDVTTDAIVDLNGGAPGKAIDLLGDNPQALNADFAAGRILVPDTGCHVAQDGGVGPRRGRGIEAVTIATGTSTWLYQPTDPVRMMGVIQADATHAFVHQGSDWFAWNPTQTTLGPALSSFPKAPFYDGAGHIVGISDKSADGGPSATLSVVAWDVATSQIATIADKPFDGVVPDLSYGLTSAHLH